jgi:kumamolisin
VRTFRRWCTRALVVGSATAIIVPGLLAASAGAAGASSTLVTIPGGALASGLPHATPRGATPSSTPERLAFYFNLHGVSSLAKMEASVKALTASRHFLTKAEVASTYGQTAATVAPLETYLGTFGITTTAKYDNLMVIANGTAGEFDAALSVKQDDYFVPAQPAPPGAMGIPAQTVHAATSSPQLPKADAHGVFEILGLTNYRAAVDALQDGTSPAKVTQTCLGCHTPGYFATQYGLKPVYAKGATGQGSTLCIVTLAAVQPTAVKDFWHTMGINRTGTFTVVTITGPTTTGTIESDLDAEQAGSLAPAANVIEYQAFNTTITWSEAFYDAWLTDQCTSISSSWGFWEITAMYFFGGAVGAASFADVFTEPFVLSAIEGQSIFVSSADTGAYGRYVPSTPTVDIPADNPYVTAAGGTTTPFSTVFSDPTTGLKATVNVSAQRAWGWTYLWKPLSKIEKVPLATEALGSRGHVGSGGGYSKLFAMPPWQFGVSGTGSYSDVQYYNESTPTLTFTGLFKVNTFRTFDAHPPLAHGKPGKGYTILTTGFTPAAIGRAVPDVSTDADPESGYYLETTPTTGATGVYGLAPDWGGTSFVAPQLNGSTAVIDSALRAACTTSCTGRVGLWSALIYTFATTKHSTPFTPLDAAGANNDNAFYTGTSGTEYNPATGLGYPNLSKLEADYAGAGF